MSLFPSRSTATSRFRSFSTRKSTLHNGEWWRIDLHRSSQHRRYQRHPCPLPHRHRLWYLLLHPRWRPQLKRHRHLRLKRPRGRPQLQFSIRSMRSRTLKMLWSNQMVKAQRFVSLGILTELVLTLKNRRTLQMRCLLYDIPHTKKKKEGSTRCLWCRRRRRPLNYRHRRRPCHLNLAHPQHSAQYRWQLQLRLCL